MKTYFFKVVLSEEDGVWIAVVPALPGCNAQENTKEAVLTAIQDTTHAYIETLIEDGEPIPVEEETVKNPLEVTAVSVVVV